MTFKVHQGYTCWLLYRSDPEVVRSARFQGDKEIVLAAVAQNAQALRYASLELQADKEVVLAAVTQCGWALGYASKTLQADQEVVVAATVQILASPPFKQFHSLAKMIPS